MPITSPLTTPANYTDPSITRYGLVSGLNIVNVHAYDKFIEKYGFMPYTTVAALSGQEMKAENKMFTWYEARGRYMGFVAASADVTVANSAAATITVAAGGYSQTGTKSLPSFGMIFRNSRTGVDGRVSAVPNKATASAHTFALTPVVTGQNTSVLAGDELLGRGFLYLGEQSDKTETVIRNIDKYTNYCTELRADDTIGDLAGAERIEFQINGNHSFTYKQFRDTEIRLMWEKELLIMEGTQTSNLPYVEEGSNGVVKQVQANGINGTYNAWGVTTTFAMLERALSSVGAPREYDILSDKSATIAQQNAIFTEINNGAIVFADKADTRGGINLERDVNSFKIYKRKYNFINYDLFDEQTVYGSSGLGVRNNFSLFIPRGTTSASANAEGTKTVSLPRFSIMYQTPFGGNKWNVGETGFYAEGGSTSTKAEKVMTTIGYFGARVLGASQYAILQGI